MVEVPAETPVTVTVEPVVELIEAIPEDEVAQEFEIAGVPVPVSDVIPATKTLVVPEIVGATLTVPEIETVLVVALADVMLMDPLGVPDAADPMRA